MRIRYPIGADLAQALRAGAPLAALADEAVERASAPVTLETAISREGDAAFEAAQTRWAEAVAAGYASLAAMKEADGRLVWRAMVTYWRIEPPAVDLAGAKVDAQAARRKRAKRAERPAAVLGPPQLELFPGMYETPARDNPDLLLPDE